MTLDRPDHNNSISLEMVRTMRGLLDLWADSSDISGVIIQGANNRVFSVGGDLQALYQARERGDAQFAETYFREEFALNHLIASFPKPIIAVLNGISMGGGVGLAAHATFRVATETTLFAMPETGIGYFPDCGASRFLGRDLGAAGLYLALTGSRLTAASVHALGLATHFIPLKDLGEISLETLDSLTITPPGQPLAAERRTAIERVYGSDSLTGIIAGLAQSDDPWMRSQTDLLERHCPLSLAVTFELFRSRRPETLDDLFATDYGLSQHFSRGTDFHEGIRAAVVEKGYKPRWSHSGLDAVTPDEVMAFFHPPLKAAPRPMIGTP